MKSRLALSMVVLLSVGVSQPAGGQASPNGVAPNLIAEEKVLRRTNDGVAIVKVTQYERPPFYDGKMPLTYETAKRELGSFSSTRLTLWNDFGAFRNTFAIGPSDRNIPGIGFSLPASARATDSHGYLLAEASVVSLRKGVGVEIEEVHYSSTGKPSFKCRSLIGFNGYKTNETAISGVKAREYFFLWPTGH